MANVNVIIEKVLKNLKIPSGIKLNMKLHNNLPDIEIDSQQIGQVFYNIITNAVQAMADDGELTIETNLDSDYIVTFITDTGSGIAEENLKKIFEPLFSTKAKGTGLGLPVCVLLVEKHRGEINVESRPGKGTTFIVKLPIARIAGISEQVPADTALESAAAVAAKGE
jgi:signal transduction histidine kinase